MHNGEHHDQEETPEHPPSEATWIRRGSVASGDEPDTGGDDFNEDAEGEPEDDTDATTPALGNQRDEEEPPN